MLLARKLLNEQKKSDYKQEWVQSFATLRGPDSQQV